MSNILEGTLFSKGLYSSWCHMPHQDLLFDAGEGAATAIENGLANITKIFIGHDHGDHTLGLPSIIGCRNMGRQIARDPTKRSHNKPLDIYAPADNRRLGELVDFMNLRNSGWLRYDLTWHPITPGFTLEIKPNTYIKAFSMRHQKDQTTLGYVIYENRRRLKAEFRGQDIRALKLLKDLTDNDLMETTRTNLFAYCLDTYHIDDPEEIRGCEKVVMDCTFLNPNDRDDPTHYTFDEAVDVCLNMNVKMMYAAHISPRYLELPRDQVVKDMKVIIADPSTQNPIS